MKDIPNCQLSEINDSKFVSRLWVDEFLQWLVQQVMKAMQKGSKCY